MPSLVFCGHQAYTHPLNSNLLSINSAADNEELTREVTDADVEEAVKSLAPHKAPGPDAFPATFFSAYWGIVGKDVKKVVRHVFATGSMPATWKETHIVLIPKLTKPSKSISDRLVLVP